MLARRVRAGEAGGAVDGVGEAADLEESVFLPERSRVPESLSPSSSTNASFSLRNCALEVARSPEVPLTALRKLLMLLCAVAHREDNRSNVAK